MIACRYVAWLSIAYAVVGCGGGGIKTHTVRGTVKLPDGDVALLAGSLVEFVHDSDPAIRSSGKIESDGTFIMETLHGGVVQRGAPEGAYKARIILADPSDEGIPKRSGNPVHPRFLDASKSGLTFTVPGGDYTLNISRK